MSNAETDVLDSAAASSSSRSVIISQDNSTTKQTKRSFEISPETEKKAIDILRTEEEKILRTYAKKRADALNDNLTAAGRDFCTPVEKKAPKLWRRK